MTNEKSLNPVARIDYYSIVLYNVSIGDIFSKFKIEFANGDLPDIKDTLDMHLRQVMYRVSYFRLTVNLSDHQITADEMNRNYSFMPASERATFFTRKYSSVKLEAAGSELNALRQAGFDVEAIFCDRLFWFDILTDCKLTRCDFAFDFIDHPSSDFPQLLARYLAKMQTEDKLRLCTSNSRPSGLVYKIERSPTGCCCYLGAQRSPEFVRVYDKLQEQAEKVYGTYDTNAWGDLCEFRGCKSWTRIELQCRREKAVKMLYSEGDPQSKMMSILRYIFENYMVCDVDHNPESFIKEYFDISNIQKVNFVQFEELVKYKPDTQIVRRINTWLERNAKMLNLVFTVFGVKGLVKYLNNERLRMYKSDKAIDLIKSNSYNLLVSQYLIEEQMSLQQLPGRIVDENGFALIGDNIEFSLVETVSDISHDFFQSVVDIVSDVLDDISLDPVTVHYHERDIEND